MAAVDEVKRKRAPGARSLNCIAPSASSTTRCESTFACHPAAGCNSVSPETIDARWMTESES